MPVTLLHVVTQGGKDAASARYIFTKLRPVTRLLFPEADDALLPRVQDDGMLVEPVAYAPIIPLVRARGPVHRRAKRECLFRLSVARAPSKGEPANQNQLKHLHFI
jgi:hypothetical protein